MAQCAWYDWAARAWSSEGCSAAAEGSGSGEVLQTLAALTLLALLGYLFWLNWKLTLFVGVLFPAVALLMRTVSKRLRRLARDAGAPILGLHWLLVAPAGLSITSADAALRSQTLSFMRGLVFLAADLGAIAPA